MSYLSLKIFKENQLIKTKIFTDDQISIGSSEGLNLQLVGLSPWHLLIEKKHDIFCILDLNSETGTKVNGQSITEETPLSSGDKISAGSYELQFFVGAPSKQDPSSSITSSHLVTENPVVPSHTKTPVVPSHTEKPTFLKSSPSKPNKKGFWNTYAPLGKIQNLDEFLQPSVGNLIEVLICWKERILSTHYFWKSEDVFIGSGKDCQVKFPIMLDQTSYKLLTIASGAKVYFSHGVKGVLFQGKDKSTRTSHNLTGNQHVIIKPYEMIKLDFNPSLKLYVRLMNKPDKIPFVGLLNLKLSEALALFLAFLLTGLLIFYGSLYAPVFLTKDITQIEQNMRVAKVIFKKPTKVTVTEVKKESPKIAQKKRKPKIKIKKKKLKTKKIKKFVKQASPVKRIQKKKKIVSKTVAKKKPIKKKIVSKTVAKKKPIKKKVSAGSVRPGGSLNVGKKASPVKTVAPDPNKVGLLGAYGGGGRLSKLDKGSTGSGALLGLAKQSSGLAGTDESYGGEGIGTKTKDLSSGGQGGTLVGISGIKTKGKGLNQGTRAGGLGKRGRMSIEIGTEDIDVSGEIDRNGILQVLIRNEAKFNHCYQRSLNEQPSIQGNLKMEWMISSSGRGQGAKSIQNSIGSETLAKCVAGVLERLNFPEPPSGQTTKVKFPFRFSL